jgi:hypothetical protein
MHGLPVLLLLPPLLPRGQFHQHGLHVECDRFYLQIWVFEAATDGMLYFIGMAGSCYAWPSVDIRLQGYESRGSQRGPKAQRLGKAKAQLSDIGWC